MFAGHRSLSCFLRFVAWAPERSQALPNPCRGLRSRHSYARALRVRHSKRGRKRQNALLFVIQTNVPMAIVIVAQIDAEVALLVIVAAPEAD
jgi:hypothetical protein